MNDDSLSPQERALFEAAEGGNTEQIRVLLDQGAEVDSRDELGNTPLIQAARNGHLDTVELLLQRGAELDAYSLWNTTALLAACQSGNIALIRLLLAKGANAYAESVEGDRALYYAARHDSPELVDLLAPFSDLPQEESTGGGGSALPQTCYHGNIKAAKRMLEWGISPNARHYRGMASALHYACNSGKMELVKMLLDAGANPLDNGYGEQHPIGDALCANPFNPAVAELMLQLGNNINGGNEFCGTPLEGAREHGTEEGIAWALAHGAKTYAELTDDEIKAFEKSISAPSSEEDFSVRFPFLMRDSDDRSAPLSTTNLCYRAHSGWTVLMTAIGSGKTHDIRTVLKAGQRVDGSNVWAAHVRRILGIKINKCLSHRIVKALCADWAFRYTKTLYEDSTYCVSSLTRACARLNERAAAILLDAGVDVNSRDRFTYRTPLFAACSPEGDTLRPSLVERLLAAGADVNATDDFGQTPLHALCMLPASPERDEVQQLLLQAGADAVRQDVFGKTPEDYQKEIGPAT